MREDGKKLASLTVYGRWFGHRDIAVKQNAVLTSRCGKMGFAKDVYQKKIEAVGYVAVVA